MGARHRYIAKMQPPSAVTHCIYCTLSPLSHHLVIAKGCVLEVLEVSRGILSLKCEFSLHGRVASLAAFQPAKKLNDLIMVLVEHRMFCVLGLDRNGLLVSISKIEDLSDSLGRTPELAPTTLAHSCHCIAFGFTSGLLKFAEVNPSGHVDTMFDSRIHSSYIIDAAFLNDSSGMLVLAVLGENCRSSKHVLTYLVCIESRTLQPGPWQLDVV
jgi:hypothetical protein